MLGEIKIVNLRKIWKNEYSNFTPWLSENLHLLGKAIGIELEFEAKEVSVGPFSADILAKDTGTDKFVIIENQLEKTDHDHLGKCITYASVLDASAVIWIASKFTDEHKKALDWLNDHTSEEIGFYGIKVELWQIENSLPAVRFNVISQPNLAVRQASKSKEQTELTENRRTQLKFWEEFSTKLIETRKIGSVQSPRAQYWFDVALGKSGIHLSNTFNTETNEIGVRVYINNKKVEDWWPYFESRKVEIEQKMGIKLNWNPNPDNKDKVIMLVKAFNLEQNEEWEAALDWLVDYTLRFREVFSNEIKNKTK
ncbi:MAG: DUF4268 domain-containing protein [Ignavibacteriae bacterium]|nr:DUF4268 domain-containing protein [Ignavibacteriota bacterium]